MKLELDEDVAQEWLFWRVVLHERTRATLHEIETLWSFEDLDRYNHVIDALDRAQAQRAAQEQR